MASAAAGHEFDYIWGKEMLFCVQDEDPGNSRTSEVQLDQCSNQHLLVPLNPSLRSFLCVWVQVKPG